MNPKVTYIINRDNSRGNNSTTISIKTIPNAYAVMHADFFSCRDIPSMLIPPLTITRVVEELYGANSNALTSA